MVIIQWISFWWEGFEHGLSPHLKLHLPAPTTFMSFFLHEIIDPQLVWVFTFFCLWSSLGACFSRFLPNPSPLWAVGWFWLPRAAVLPCPAVWLHCLLWLPWPPWYPGVFVPRVKTRGRPKTPSGRSFFSTFPNWQNESLLIFLNSPRVVTYRTSLRSPIPRPSSVKV